MRTIDALAPRPEEPVIRTRWYDAFAGTEVDGALRARGVSALQRAALDIVGRAFGRVVSSKEVLDTISGW